MNSLLGKQIEIMQNLVLEMHGPAIVKRFMEVYREFNEEPITEFVFVSCSEDEDEWETALKCTEVDPKWLAEKIGLTWKQIDAGTFHFKWSGV